MTKTNDLTLKSWIPIEANSDFPIQNLPFGIFKNNGKHPRVGVAIGKYVLDLYELNKANLLQEFDLTDSILENYFLNDFILLGKKKTSAIRNKIAELLSENDTHLQGIEDVFKKFLVDRSKVEMLLPVKAGDYTDFYSSEVHATNVGKMFRPENPLLPNWKHMPIGYHGRSSSIIVSGENIFRPKGQLLDTDNVTPIFSESKQLDFELEMAFITFEGKQLGQHITTEEADDYIFGMVLFNDWSARDIQRWEYVPLGPFLGKNFASSMSPWVVTLDALEPFRVSGPQQNPEVLPYLQFKGAKNIDIKLQVDIIPENKIPTTVCTSNFKYLYWNMEQQLAHQTINGCNIKAGDVYGSGTISAPDQYGYGSMLELTWRGTKPMRLSDDTERKFINDNDTVIMKGWCEKKSLRIGFGEVRAKLLPAL
ncbi:MAG: fumarylacetoacetase [Bacteroidetes bacterium]|nr:fumarylacetoacetase [Bacteroidota bacterium]